jgi:class 3 adenylate cyclase
MGSNRTLAAIVFTDAVGFSALASMNEERALSLIQDDFALMRKIASTHLGQALKTTGDGMLLVFGSALDAIAFSVAFQQRERREGGFEHRIGVHVGDVMLSEQDAQGDGVNVAARIQQSAPAGGIWISASAYDMVKNRTDIPIRSAGNQRFKNLPDAIHCYEVGVGGKFSKSRRPSSPVIVSNATMAGLATIVSGLAIAVASINSNKCGVPHMIYVITLL